jgi:multiple sugar transport system permease protein
MTDNVGKGHSNGTVIFRNIVCIILCFFALIPFWLLFVNSTLSDSAINQGLHILPGLEFINNFKKVLVGTGVTSTVSIQKALLNSLIITVPTTILQVYFGALTAYGVTVYDFKLKKFAWAFIYGIMMIPTQVSIVGLIKVCQITHLYGTRWPLILPAIAAPTTVYFMKQYMEGGLSIEIIEASRIDGAGEFKTFNKIVLPILKPAMATQAIFAFVASWNNLYTPSILLATNADTKGTLPMFVAVLKANDKERDFGQIYCGLFLTVLPILVAYLLLSRYIVEGVALGGVKE